MTIPSDPTIIGSASLGKMFYEAMRHSSEQAGGTAPVAWDGLAESDRARWTVAAAEVLALLVNSRVIDKRYAQLPPGAGRVLPAQRGN